MIADLQEATDEFESVNEAVDEAMKPIWTDLGFTEETREAYFQQTMAAMRAGDAPESRRT
jgi:hypothetical protein